ncbi:MICOS complex subunit MIC13-like [Clavelina lepadiformis]|uniref:MICOS complex subunit MIC13-like n=1 Tax=Clavelina lepadiformis TaxID=159417 RepID=UPI004042924C
MALAKIVKFGAKLGLFGGAIYLTTANGVWGNNSEQSIKSLQKFGENVDAHLGGSYLTQVKVPSVELNLSEKWNYGVSKSLDFMADVPEKVTTGCKNGINYVADQWK